MSQDDFQIEPVPGLPANLPDGEHIVWQGKPETAGVARDAFHTTAIAIYFALLIGWRVMAGIADGRGAMDLFSIATATLALGALVLAILFGIAALVKRTTIYTITNRRVVMRFGIALPITFQLPFTQITSADVKPLSGGRGNIALELKEHTKISWPILWPHVRAWKLARPQPLLRAIGDVDAVAEKLASGLRAAHGQPAQTRMAIETSEGSAQPFQPNVAGATAH
ncbi:MAG: photosynthetic complex putative assembly protein PuhB [Pseudomonadota bacterium]